MLYSKLFGKTLKTPPKDEISTNAKLLIRAGFIDKLMAGSYSLLPLGWLVKNKIENIVRSHLNSINSQEAFMPLLHPKNIWNETGRWDSAKEIMYQFKKEDKEYTLSFTHEEIVLDLARKHLESYKDLPVKIYHFSTKFRNELRAKSGLLRCREFIMNDLYSLHATSSDLDKFYWQVADTYSKIFDKLGLKTKITEAAGGVFTDNLTHEFQVLCESGEDTIYYCENNDFAQNKEIAKVKEDDKCPKCGNKIKVSKAIEVGNIFRFGTSYSQKMGVFYKDNQGKNQLVHLASYGIGITRVIGALAEIYSDAKGIIWPASVAPFQVHLIGLGLNDRKVKDSAQKTYQKLKAEKVEVLFDDREESTAGEKFADADLIGIPWRLVISKKTQEKFELKKRTANKIELLELNEIVKKIAF